MIAPSKLPTIFNGDKAVIYGIFKSKKSQQSALSGTATLCQTKGDLKHTIPFEIPAPSKDRGTLSMPIVHHLAAKSLIKDWQAGEGLKGLPETRRKDAIIKLSIESSVVSAHTAYIAVDEEQDKPIEGAIKTWDVTAMMTDRDLPKSGIRFGGGGGGGGGRGGMKKHKKNAAPMFRSPMAASPPHAARSRGLALAKGGPPPSIPTASVSYDSVYSNRSKSADLFLSEDVLEKEESVSRRVRTSQTGELSALISLQQAEGNWKLDTALASILSKSLQQLEGACPVECKGDIRTVWATVLALVFLEAKHSAKHDEWELVAMKAEFWLQGQTFPAGTDLDSFMIAAKKAV